MKNVINKYKKFTFVYVSINLFALLVNVFNIDSSFEVGPPNDITSIHYFTHSSTFERDQFYPFVTYVHTTAPGNAYSRTVFEGIFYKYGLAEFVIYIGLFLGFLVYKSYISTPGKVKVPSV